MDKEIRNIISKNLQDIKRSYTDEDDLITTLGINSLAIVKIITDIEDYYGICFDLDELVQQDQYSVKLFEDMITAALQKKGGLL